MCVATRSRNQRSCEIISADTGESFEGVLQRAQGVHVQIIARSSAAAHGTGFQHLGQMDAIPLATGERADFLLLIRAGQIEAGYIGAGIDNLSPSGICSCRQKSLPRNFWWVKVCSRLIDIR